MASDELIAKVYEVYPALAFLLNDPEVGPLMLQAVDRNSGLTPSAFQAKLAQTNWWKSSSQSQKQWETLLNTDPGQAAQQKQAWMAEVSRRAAQQGVKLEGVDLNWWADYFMPRGLTANDPRLDVQIAQVYATRPDLRTAGTIQATGADLRGIAAQYFMPLAPGDEMHWQTQIAAGRSTLDAFEAEMQRQAAGRWGSLEDEINSGLTPQQLFASQRNAIANELELDPSQVDLMSDPRFARVLGIPDEKGGGTRPMTYAESIVLARSLPEWNKTVAANDKASAFALQLAQTFGEVK